MPIQTLDGVAQIPAVSGFSQGCVGETQKVGLAVCVRVCHEAKRLQPSLTMNTMSLVLWLYVKISIHFYWLNVTDTKVFGSF